MFSLRHFVKVSVFAIACRAFLFGQDGPPAGKMEGSIHRAERSADWRTSLPADAIRTMARPTRKISLKALTSAEASSVKRKPGLTAVGVSRALPADVLAQGQWSISPEGKRVWRLALQSTGAETVRLRFADFHAGSGQVWIFTAGADAASAGVGPGVGPYSGDGLFGDGAFWSDLSEGDSVIVAYEPAADAVASDAVPFRLVELSHRIKSATAKSAAAPNASAEADPLAPAAAAASCTLDVSCYSQYSEPASAVALMIFESDGGSYECTGSLISSAAQPARPYFLTANHCIATADEARSLIAIFNDQTSSCGGRAPSLSNLPRVNGATFVEGEAMARGDFSLLQLSSFPNVDVKVLGWLSDPLAAGATVASISHPRGDYKRIAFGQRTRDVTIRLDDGQRMPASVGYQVSWSQGVTQSGSSGSPLLVEVGGKQFIAGTLTAGPAVNENNSAAVCRVSNLNASYGRFAAAFPYLSSFLTSTAGNGPPTGSPQTTFTANPAIITLPAGRTLASTTLYWQVSGATRVQIRLNSPTGPPMTGFDNPSGSAQTGDWVSNGMTFYLQDATDGNSAGSSKTLASVRVQVITR